MEMFAHVTNNELPLALLTFLAGSLLGFASGVIFTTQFRRGK